MHVHVSCPEGEAKFWLEPVVEVAQSFRLGPKRLKELQAIIEERKHEIAQAWKKHFTR